MIKLARVQEIAGLLDMAGDGWPDAARELPEFFRLKPAVKPRHPCGCADPVCPAKYGPAAWVQLDDEIEGREGVPSRIFQHQTGVWFLITARCSCCRRREWRPRWH